MRLQMYPLDISDLLSSSDCPGGEMGGINNRLIPVSAIFRILNFTANKYTWHLTGLCSIKLKCPSSKCHFYSNVELLIRDVRLKMQQIPLIYSGKHHNCPQTMKTFKVNICHEQLVTRSLFYIQPEYLSVKIKERTEKKRHTAWITLCVKTRAAAGCRLCGCVFLYVCKSCFCSNTGDREWTIQMVITALQEISVGKRYLIAQYNLFTL